MLLLIFQDPAVKAPVSAGAFRCAAIDDGAA